MERQINLTRDFYKKADLWLPEHSRWRMFKLQLWNNKIVNVFGIKNGKMLRGTLLRFAPKHVWFGVSGWLVPKEVKGFRTRGDNVNLFRDLPIDIDAEVKPGEMPSLEQLEEAFERMKLVRDFLIKKLGEPTYVIFSGCKGFHIYYGQSEKVDSFIKEEGYKPIEGYIDAAITKDKFRVVRLPLTMNGSLCSDYLVSTRLIRMLFSFINSIFFCNKVTTLSNFKSNLLQKLLVRIT